MMHVSQPGEAGVHTGSELHESDEADVGGEVSSVREGVSARCVSAFEGRMGWKLPAAKYDASSNVCVQDRDPGFPCLNARRALAV